MVQNTFKHFPDTCIINRKFMSSGLALDILVEGRCMAEFSFSMTVTLPLLVTWILPANFPPVEEIEVISQPSFYTVVCSHWKLVHKHNKKQNVICTVPTWQWQQLYETAKHNGC